MTASELKSIFPELLKELAASVCACAEKTLPTLGSDWWRRFVEPCLCAGELQRFRRMSFPSLALLDHITLLEILDRNWYAISKKLSRPLHERDYVREMMTISNRFVQLGPDEEVSCDDLIRALDTMSRVGRVVDAHENFLHRLRGLRNGPCKESGTGSGRGAIDPPSYISRGTAIRLANGYYGKPILSTDNVSFANINNGRPDVWWLNPPGEWFQWTTDVNILLYDFRARRLYHLAVPTVYLRQNRERLRERRDTRRINLQLSANKTSLFRNIAPADSEVEFKQFLRATIPVGK